MTDDNGCDYGLHEALDRAYIIGLMLDELLAAHPAITSRPNLNKRVDDLVEQSAELYQAIGRVRP